MAAITLSDAVQRQHELVDFEQSIASILQEATDELDGSWALVGGDATATHTGGLQSMGLSMTTVRDRADGRYVPFYETEFQLARMRATCRNLATYTSVAVGALESLRVYTMGGDWEYEVKPAEGMEVPPDLIAEVQKIVNDILARNDFEGVLDSEVHDASREDGETLIGAYATTDGLVDLRRIEPDCLREPQRKTELERWLGINVPSSWSFGVHTLYDQRQNRVDHTRHAGYHIVFDDGGSTYDYLPAWPMPHLPDRLANKFGHLIKRNVRASAKRGVSDYWPLLVDLEREDKLSGNLAVGTSILAAIPWIEELPAGGTRENATGDLTDALDQFSRAVAANRGRGNERTLRKFRAGTIPIVSAGRKYHAGPLGGSRQPIYIDVAQHLKRRIGNRWLMPEYMISGDASNANFASTLVAESPFVRARESDQEFYVQHFRTLLLKCLKIAFDAGRFRRWANYCKNWSAMRKMVDILIKPQSPASRDKAAIVDEIVAMYDRGLLYGNEFRKALRYDARNELETRTGSGPAPPTLPFGLFGAAREARLPRLESLAASALKRLTESATSEERWVTLDNGNRVKIDANGTVVSGPAALRGKNLGADRSHKRTKTQSVIDEMKSRAKSITHNHTKDAFNAPFTPRTWLHDKMGQAAYGFETSAGAKYGIYVRRDEQFEGVDIRSDFLQFVDEQGRYTATGAGGAHEVFGQVVPATIAYVNSQKPPILHFTAEGESRQRLYNRLVKASTATLPEYTAYWRDRDDGIRDYVVVHDDSKRWLDDTLDLMNATRIESTGADRPKWQQVEPECDPSWFTPDGWRDGDHDGADEPEQASDADT